MLKKTILILSLFAGILFGGSTRLHPVVKSALLPGWGEAALQNSKRARIFRLVEVSLVTACISAYTFSGHQAKQYESFAVEHAGIDARGKEHQYWVDLGNYSDMASHNEEHLRFREMESLYAENEGWNWTWDSKENKSTFETMRIRSDVLGMMGKFIIGSIVVNHIVSAIDVLYLTRLEKIESISLIPKINPDGTGSLSFKVEFDL
ncbi:MAG TPA: hypothetical protein EYO16_02625 [Candidatus Marinimicrobia bacterium]|jgi:hypothetical protein|nr:hypothetical protein [Candidatus Neomarinimicrobiota bacterium]